MNECLFCKIIKKEIPAEVVYENEFILGFKDIRPQAEVHLLFIHKGHTSDINEMTKNKASHIVDIFSAIEKYTTKEKIDTKGFRLITNLGKEAGQTVFHTHFHLISGGDLNKFGV